MKTGMKLLTHVFLCFLAIFLFTKQSNPGNMVYVYGVVLSLIACIYHFIREKTQKFLPFACYHLLGVLLSILIVINVNDFRYIGYFSLAIVIYSIVIRYVPIDLEEPKYLHLILFILVYYLVPQYQTICLYMTIAFFLLVLLYNNMESMNFYIATRSLTTTVDENELKRTTRSVSLIYVGILGLIMCIVGIVHTNQVWRFIGRILRKMIRFIMGIFFEKENEMTSEEPTEDGAGEAPLITPEELGESSRFAEILSDIIQILAIIIFVAIVLILIVKMIIWFYHYFYESKIREDANIVIERISRLDHKLNKRNRFKRDGDKKSLNRIRKMYRKMLKRKGANDDVRIRFLTPKAQLDYLCKLDFKDQDLSELQQLYEKARYGNEEVSADDVARFKTIYNERNHTR